MKLRNVLVALVAALIVMGLISTSSADMMVAKYIDFNMDANHPSNATISYGTKGGSLSGQNISVDTVQGFIDQNQNTGSALTITNGALNFTTGTLTSYNNNVWTFGSGGNITLTGGVSSIGINDNNSTTLLSGSFGTAVVQMIPVVFDGLTYFNFSFLLASFSDTKNDTLAEYFFGSNPGAFVGGLNLSFTTLSLGQDNTFTSQNLGSGDIINTPVPLPEAFWLLGSGLIALVGIRRKAFFG